MAAAANAKRKHSWWWDSHISPKNSKWLKENLSDMNVKVNQMLKLIEEDADSFARRAEMYYKKRPELKKMLEDFFREYRALAERYDHATVVLRHAHKTMSDAQLPLMMSDELLGGEFDFQTPEKNGAFTDDSDSGSGKKGLKQFNGGVFGSSIRRGLNFQDSSEEKEGSSKFEAEIQKLKNDLLKLESEKEATLLQYQQSMQKVSEFEAEVSHAQEESAKLNERAQEAEFTVQSLKELLSKSEGEKDDALEKVTELEKLISIAEIDAKEAKVEIETLKQDLVKTGADKETALEKIKGLEDELRIAEEEAKKLIERATKAESEVERMKEALAKLTEEKEAVAFKCQQCLEKISDLESRLANELEKLRLAEERCLLLETTNETMNTELVEKQKELGNLWTCIQEERLRFVEAETAFQTLQHLHSHSQDELRSLAAQLDNTNQILKEMEDRNQILHNEVEKVSEQNKNLNESSSLTINGLQVEISSLRETIQKLEQEIELRVDQRNALQQEIYCLKEELNDLNKRNRGLLDQVDLVGLDPDSLGQSVKDLQDENSKLKEMCDHGTTEKAVLLAKLVIMEELIQKNVLLENSLSDLNVELEGVRDRVKMLEESYESLAMEKAAEKDALVSELQGVTEKVEKLAEENGFLENFLSNANAEVEELRVKSISLEELKTGLETEKGSLMSQLGTTQQNLEDLERRYKELEEVRVFVEKEKDSLVTQLHMMSEKVEKLAEKNGFLESSLSDSNLQVEELRVKSKALEESCELLGNEKTSLETELGSVTSQLGLAQQNLADLEKRYAELEEIRVFVEKEKDSVLLDMKKLRDELDEERHKNLDLESQILLLQQQLVCMNNDYGDELDKNSTFQVEIFVLQKCMQDLKDRITSLELDQKVRKLRISALENQNLEHQVELKSLTSGLYQMLKVLDVNGKNGFERLFEKDQNPIEHIIWKMKDLQNSLSKAQDENLQAAIEKSVAETLIREMELEAADLCTERNTLDQHHKDKSKQLIILQREFEDVTEKLAVEVLEGLCREDVLRSELQILYEYLVSLKDEHSAVCEEKKCLMDDFLQLKEEKSKLEEDNHVLFGETISLSTFSVILKHNALQRSSELKEMTKCQEVLNLVNNDLRDKLKMVECSLEKSEHELTFVKSVNLDLNSEVANGKEMLNRLEIEKEAVQKDLEGKLLKLLEENEEHMLREENLENDVQKWEAEAAALFGKLIISEVRELLLEEKLVEVNEASHSSSAINAAEIEALEKKVVTLDGENGELNGKVAAYVSALYTLEECVSSLENSFDLDNETKADDDKEIKDVELMSDNPTDNHPEEASKGVVIPIVPGSEAHDLPMRLRAIEKALLIKTQEHDDLSSKLVSAMEEINNLKSKASPHPENSQTDKTFADGLTKDIVLDQISESSSFVALSRRATVDANDDQMLELWEDPKKSTEIEIEPKKDHRSLNPSAESLSGISETAQGGVGGGGGKKKVLERLDSDVQKLTNLQITVEDLKRKVGSTEKTSKGKIVEYDSLKGQLEEAEASILKLFDSNRELVKNIENSDENVNVSRRRVSEQARRGSEKIGRLQLELQKIQFLLLKLDGRKELGKDKGARLMTDHSARILLQDYLYGSSRKNRRENPKKKKATFCGCAPKVVD